MTRAGHIPQDVQFEAVIAPHRSLSATGLRILLGAVLAACVISSTVFTLAAALHRRRNPVFDNPQLR